jgi:phosphoribosylamine--glycine ligase
LEFNVRFGDPETQAVLIRMASDLIPALEACVDGTLKQEMVQWRPEAAACVVMASGGYPGKYEKGVAIAGLSEANAVEGATVFHAGTDVQDSVVVTSGGRVLGVTALGATLDEAVKRSYDSVAKIAFEGAHWRKDIAAKACR